MTDTPAANGRGERLRLAHVGAGWITTFHLDALDRLGRTELVGVASARLERAAAIASPRGVPSFDHVERLLDTVRPDVAYVAVPPWASVAIGEALVERGIPFLTEKPLAATDDDGPARLAAAIERRGLVVAVGYHLRALEAMPEVRRRLAAAPVQLVDAWWLDSTPGPAWWRVEATGGGQVVEQATHLYDLARVLVGEASVVGATSVREEPVVPEGADVVDATASLLRFDSGAIGSFVNSRRLSSATIGIELASAGLLTAIRKVAGDQRTWEVSFVEGPEVTTIAAGRDPYEIQAEAFLDAVEANDPSGVLCTYADALRTYRLTRAVVAATARPG
jgi:myo-inositol 2-dehydrogenase/D-chiro-inositol 1-dehydrogenase